MKMLNLNEKTSKQPTKLQTIEEEAFFNLNFKELIIKLYSLTNFR